MNLEGIMIEKYLSKIDWHPWIFPFYYVFYPYVLNIQHLYISSLIKPLIIVLVGSSIFFSITVLIFKDVKFASILTSLSLILFFSYPPLFLFVQLVNRLFEKSASNFESTRLISMFFVIILYLILYLIAWYFLRKSTNARKLFTVALNAASILLIVAVAAIAVTKTKDIAATKVFQKNWDKKVIENTKVDGKSLKQKRDIYLIILDGYGSQEVLSQLYDYDNSRFEDELQDMGFIIVPNAKTNYSQTRTSFSSMLNMQYLDEIAQEAGKENADAHPLINMIQNNLVSVILKNEGYTVINFPSGYEYTEGIRADYQIKTGVYLDNFSQTLIWDSVVYPFLHKNLYHWHRNNITNTINGLSTLDSYPAPKFVIAHIFAPHPPFVFDETGKPLTPPYSYSAIDADTLIRVTGKDYYKEHYKEQLSYISKELLVTLNNILDNSVTKPIIIMSGDHGPALTVSLENSDDTNHFERMHILNALYLPEVESKIISPDHTPVNTFRLVFNEYFGYDYPMLENRSFESSYLTPYDFKDVTEESDYNKVTNK
jgi:hypothetical protein